MQFDQNSAALIAHHAAKTLGLPSRKLRCIRFGQNGIFCSPSDNLVLRVHRPGTSLAQVQREISISVHLGTKGVPCTTPFSTGTPNVLEVGNCLVSTWALLREEGEATNLSSLASLARAFHRAMIDWPGARTELPWISLSIDRLEKVLDCGPVDKSLIQGLIARVEELRGGVSRSLRTNLGAGFIHGDFHRGNVISTNDGIYLSDFERVSFAEFEWDAIPTIVALRRFGHSNQDQQEFAVAYGGDILSTPNIEHMIEIREIFMLTSIMNLAGTSKSIDDSIHHQTKTILTGEKYAQWTQHW